MLLFRNRRHARPSFPGRRGVHCLASALFLICACGKQSPLSETEMPVDGSVPANGSMGGGTSATDAASVPNSSSTSSGPGGGLRDAQANTDGSGTTVTAVAGSVLQHHLNPTRDGVYVDSVLTEAVAATVAPVTTFAGTVTGAVFAQPLYVAQGPNGQEAFYVATEENHVTAISGSGAVIWDKTFGAPATRTNLNCGIISPLGITSTPIIDLASRTLYFDAMTVPTGSTTPKHEIYAISIDDGSTVAGWPISPEAASVAGTSFVSVNQNQRGALQLVNGMLYVPYGGHVGDCTPYYGWVVGVPVANPSAPVGWATGLSIGMMSAGRGGIWASGGVASDGTYIYVSTGNTSKENDAGAPFSSPGTWSGGEAVFKFTAGPTFATQAEDDFYPTNWAALDTSDGDLGGANPVVLDMPGAPNPHLLVALGKDGNLYLLDRDHLGGIGGELVKTPVANGNITGAAAVYTTSKGTYVAFRTTGSPTGCPTGQSGGNLGAAKITPGSPPTVAVAWCATQNNLGSPMVTMTGSGGDAGAGEVIVWDANTSLYAYDGDTGTEVCPANGCGAAMASTMQYYNTPIDLGDGRIAVATTAGNAGTARLYLYQP